MLRGLTYFVLTAFIAFVNSDNVKFYQEKHYHEAKDLTDLEIRNLATRSDEAHFRSALNEILVPRVVGTPEHQKVGNFIRDSMKSFGWNVEEDVFVDNTPNFGSLTFRNLIATVNPNADRFLVLACHYDSKYTREYDFFGATDSAAPCAMMINLAKVMAKELSTLKESKLSLMFIFFDGEEAFRQWGPTDSIYGARHLANKWFNKSYRDGANYLQRMDMLVLLDLLGAPDPVFYSYFHQTEKWYVRLAAAEQKLADMDLLNGYTKGHDEQTYFRLRSSRSFIEDDHVPFMRKNVNILHLIPSPFPDVWHKSGDNINALDFNTIENLNKILRVFVAEYLSLKPDAV